MALTVAFPRSATATLDEIVERIRAEIRDGASPREVALTVAESMRPDEAAQRHLILLGLTRLANGQAREDRLGVSDDTLPADEAPTGAQVRGLTPRQRLDVLERVMLEGPDGSTRPLLNFTLGDCQWFRSKALAQIAGWEARERAMGVAIGLMNTHKVTVVVDLPVNALGALRAAVAEAWGRRS